MACLPNSGDRRSYLWNTNKEKQEYFWCTDTKCNINVILRGFRLIILRWKSNNHYILLLCVSSISYLECFVHASYCYMWPFLLVKYFLQFFHKRHDFGKTLIFHKICFDVLYNFKYKFFIPKRI
jgi:hypothetical protein